MNVVRRDGEVDLIRFAGYWRSAIPNENDADNVVLRRRSGPQIEIEKTCSKIGYLQSQPPDFAKMPRPDHVPLGIMIELRATTCHVPSRLTQTSVMRKSPLRGSPLRMAVC